MLIFKLNVMSRFIDKIKEWGQENWDDISLLIYVGIPSGLLCILLFSHMDYSKLF
jgi:hypothetical protein